MELISGKNCPACTLIKRKMNKMGIAYKEISPENFERKHPGVQITAIPVLVSQGQMYVGSDAFDEVENLKNG